MTRNLKALGLALAAVFAMSALSAASAQAEPTFTGYETPSGTHVHTTIKGTTDPGAIEIFDAGSKIECHNTYSATDLTGDTKTLTVTVTDWKTPNTEEGKHCKANAGGLGNFKADIEFTSCDYLFHVDKFLEKDTYTGSVDIKCTTPGDSIHIRVTNSTGGTKCLITVPEQTGLNHIVFHNKTEIKPTKVTVTATVEKIKYTQTEGGILGCGKANGNYESTYTGEATVEGFNTAGEQIDVEVSGE